MQTASLLGKGPDSNSAVAAAPSPPVVQQQANGASPALAAATPSAPLPQPNGGEGASHGGDQQPAGVDSGGAPAVPENPDQGVHSEQANPPGAAAAAEEGAAVEAAQPVVLERDKYDHGDQFHACYGAYDLLNHRQIRVFGIREQAMEAARDFLQSFAQVEKSEMVSQLRGEPVCTVTLASAAATRTTLATLRREHTTHIGEHKVSFDEAPAQGCLFLGNVPHDLPYERLHDVCARAGPLRSLHIMHEIFDPQISKGYAIVEYDDRDGAVRAKRALSTEKMGDRVLRVDWTDCKTTKSMHSPVLFVDRLPRGFVDNGVLQQTFEVYGPVVDCCVMISGGVSRGHAFVIMQHPQDAETARRSLNNTTFINSTLRVSFSKPSVTPNVLRAMLTTRNEPLGGAYPPMGGAYGAYERRAAPPPPSYAYSAPSSYSPYAASPGYPPPSAYAPPAYASPSSSPYPVDASPSQGPHSAHSAHSPYSSHSAHSAPASDPQQDAAWADYYQKLAKYNQEMAEWQRQHGAAGGAAPSPGSAQQAASAAQPYSTAPPPSAHQPAPAQASYAAEDPNAAAWAAYYASAAASDPNAVAHAGSKRAYDGYGESDPYKRYRQ